MGIVVVLMICGLWKADIGQDGGLVLSKGDTEAALQGSILGNVFRDGWLPINRALQSSARTVNMIKLAAQKRVAATPEAEGEGAGENDPKKART